MGGPGRTREAAGGGRCATEREESAGAGAALRGCRHLARHRFGGDLRAVRRDEERAARDARLPQPRHRAVERAHVLAAAPLEVAAPIAQPYVHAHQRPPHRAAEARHARGEARAKPEQLRRFERRLGGGGAAAALARAQQCGGVRGGGASGGGRAEQRGSAERLAEAL